MEYYAFMTSILLGILLSCFSIHFLLRLSATARNWSWSKSKPLPPGPFPLPILGNIFSLGSKPHKSMTELAKTYGPLMTLQLGQLTTVIISSDSMAKQVLQKNDTRFRNRTVGDSARALDHHRYSVVLMPVQDHWRYLRKICNSQLFSRTSLDAGQGLRQKKVEDVLAHVERCCRNGTSVGIGQIAYDTVLNLLSNTFFSQDLVDTEFETSREFKHVTVQMVAEYGKPNFADFFPVLRRFDAQGMRRRMSIHFRKLLDIFDDIIDRRLAADEENNLGRERTDDALDVLLKINKENSQELDRSNIIHLLLDLFVAGTETTSISLEWAMAELLHNPDKMKKAQAELEEFIGKRPIGEADIDRLPYLQAVVKETLRLHPPAPLLVPRKADTDVNIGPCTIPKNSQILTNVWAIGRDPTLWERPNSFEPERFLGSEMNFKGHDFELIPFGAGRRICPGLPLASRMVHLMLGSLIRSFNWKLANGIEPESMDMDDKFLFTLHKAQSLHAIPIPV